MVDCTHDEKRQKEILSKSCLQTSRLETLNFFNNDLFLFWSIYCSWAFCVHQFLFTLPLCNQTQRVHTQKTIHEKVCNLEPICSRVLEKLVDVWDSHLFHLCELFALSTHFISNTFQLICTISQAFSLQWCFFGISTYNSHSRYCCKLTVRNHLPKMKPRVPTKHMPAHTHGWNLLLARGKEPPNKGRWLFYLGTYSIFLKPLSADI